jgi:hypothetical protein
MIDVQLCIYILMNGLMGPDLSLNLNSDRFHMSLHEQINVTCFLFLHFPVTHAICTINEQKDLFTWST